jgi:hypothetical protein
MPQGHEDAEDDFVQIWTKLGKPQGLSGFRAARLLARSRLAPSWRGLTPARFAARAAIEDARRDNRTCSRHAGFAGAPLATAGLLSLVPFPRETVGDLIDRGDAVPPKRVMAELRKHFAEAEWLDTAGDHGSQFLRNLIFSACLLNRVIFEIHAVPKDRAARI